jgi:predicted HD superfamily hydrolase involved in NAD metabolism
MDYISVERYVASQVSYRRYLHSRSTVHQAKFLSHHYLHTDALDHHIFLAGIWHDIAREWPSEALFAYAQKHHLEMLQCETERPMLLHGPVAAHQLRLLKPDVTLQVLKAIRWHTLGSVDMGVLGALIYLADYLEPLRKHLDDAQRSEILRAPTLEKLCLVVVEQHQQHLYQTGRESASSTDELFKFLSHGGTFS